MRRHFNVISTATTQFSGTPDPLTLAPTPSDYVEHHQVQTGSSNNLATEIDIDAISVAIPMFWGKVFTGVYVNFARNFLPSEIPRWRNRAKQLYRRVMFALSFKRSPLNMRFIRVHLWSLNTHHRWQCTTVCVCCRRPASSVIRLFG